MGKNSGLIIGAAAVGALLLLGRSQSGEGGSGGGGGIAPFFLSPGAPAEPSGSTSNTYNISFPDFPGFPSGETKKDAAVAATVPQLTRDSSGGFGYVNKPVSATTLNLFGNNPANVPSVAQGIMNLSPSAYNTPAQVSKKESVIPGGSPTLSGLMGSLGSNAMKAPTQISSMGGGGAGARADTKKDVSLSQTGRASVGSTNATRGIRTSAGWTRSG